jgi:hypothetical protein
MSKYNKKTLKQQSKIEDGFDGEVFDFFSSHPILGIKYIKLLFLLLLLCLFINVVKISAIENEKLDVIKESYLNHIIVEKDIIIKKYNNVLLTKTYDVKNKKFEEGFSVINFENQNSLDVLCSQKIKDLGRDLSCAEIEKLKSKGLYK